MCTTRSGCLNGRPRKNRSLIKLKMAVFSPIPSASVSTARKVNPGDLRSWRRANFRSFIVRCSDSLHNEPRGKHQFEEKRRQPYIEGHRALHNLEWFQGDRYNQEH